MSDFVVAVVATYRRPRELSRLLDELARKPGPVGAVVVVDNGQEPEIRRLVQESDASSAIDVVYVPAENLGPGAGWKRGVEEALAHFPQRVSHLMTMDDDVVVRQSDVTTLLRGMGKRGAGLAAPLIADKDGRIGDLGVPEPVARSLRKTIRKVRSAEDALALLGRDPIDICWCIGPCVLLSRDAVELAGAHRDDFWLLGEDIEYSMRVSARAGAVVVPEAVVAHVPPPAAGGVRNVRAEYIKFCCLLQNLSFIVARTRHSRHLWRYLPGNYRRFLRTFGISARALGDAARCFWWGAVAGEPAGAASGERLRRRIMERPS